MQTCNVKIDTGKLTSILDPLSRFLRTPILFYKTESREWFGASKRNLPFCYLMEHNTATNAFCTQCDNIADQQCGHHKKAFAYHCHAGLIEVVQPIYVEDIYIGFLIIGQYRTKSTQLQKEYAEQLARLCSCKSASLLKKYYSQPIVGAEAVEGIKIIVEMLAGRLMDENVFELEYHDVVKSVERYINQNLSNILTLKDIAQNAYISPAYLSTIYKKVTGKAITDFIQERRIYHACFLIRTTSLALSEIAKQSGFSDASYFTKIFKDKRMMPPKEYRKKWKEGGIEE